jgi:hypothetical protein
MSEKANPDHDPRQDQEDIQALRESQPFNRWFLRRLNEKIQCLELLIISGVLPKANRAKRLAMIEIRQMIDTERERPPVE